MDLLLHSWHAGLAAFVMLVWGGVQWLTSGAIPSQAGEARDKIRNAILGLLLILASFLVIQVINPELTILQLPGIPCPEGAICTGQTPTLSLGDVSLETTPPKLPKGATADGIYLCQDFECKCRTGTCVGGDDPSTHDFLFVDPAVWGISTGSGGPEGLPDLGNWKDKVKSVAIKGDFDVLLADDPDYKGVVTCFTDSTEGRLSEFARTPPTANEPWSSKGAMSVKVLVAGQCQNPGITLQQESHFWANPVVFLFLNSNQGKDGSLGDASYLRYKVPANYNDNPVGGNVSGTKRSTLVTAGSTAIRLYSKVDGLGTSICFTSTENDLSLYSLDLANPSNDMTDDIRSVRVITDSDCPNPKVAEP